MLSASLVDVFNDGSRGTVGAFGRVGDSLRLCQFVDVSAVLLLSGLTGDTEH